MPHGKFIRKERSIQETKPYAQGFPRWSRGSHIFLVQRKRGTIGAVQVPHTGQDRFTGFEVKSPTDCAWAGRRPLNSPLRVAALLCSWRCPLPNAPPPNLIETVY
jgi:hypothetical protein